MYIFNLNQNSGTGDINNGQETNVMINDTIILRGIFDDPSSHLFPAMQAPLPYSLEAIWVIERVDKDSNSQENGSIYEPVYTYNITDNESEVIYLDDKDCIEIIAPVSNLISNVYINCSEKGLFDIGLKCRLKNISYEIDDPLFPDFISSRILNSTSLIVDEPGPNPPVANPGSIYADLFGSRPNIYRSVLGINMTFDGYYHKDTYDPDKDGFIVPPMEWDFGDGGSEEWRPMPKHEYGLEGSYTVTQTARDSSGMTDTSSVNTLINRWVGGGFLSLPGEGSYSGGKLRRASDGSLYIMNNFRISELDSEFNVVDVSLHQLFNDFDIYNYDMAVHTNSIFKNIYIVGFRGGTFWSNEWEDGGIYLAKYNYYDLEDENLKTFIGTDVYTPSGTVTEPILRLSSSSYDFGDISKGDSDSFNFEIWNEGASTLSYTLSETSSGLSVDPTTGESTGEHDVINVNVSNMRLNF